MIYDSLRLKDKNNNVLKKYFSTQNNWQVLDEKYRKRLTSKNSLLEFELDLLENEIQILLSKSSLSIEENRMLENIRTYFNTRVNSNTMTMLYPSSPIFNEQICLMTIFDENQRKRIQVQKERIKIDIDINFKKYLAGEPLPENDQIILFSYLSSEYSNIKEYKQLKRKISANITKTNKQNNYYEVKFLYNYLHQKQGQTYGYEACKLYFDHQIPSIDSKGNIFSIKFPSIVSNAGCLYDGIIVMNSFVHHFKYDKNINCYGQNLYNNISTLSHESWHQKQFDDFINQRYTPENLAHIIAMLLFPDQKFYRINYDFAIHEYQANYHKNLETIGTIRANAPFNNDNELAIRQIKYLEDSQNRLNIINSYAMVLPDITKDGVIPQISDEYVVSELENKLKQKPNLVKNYKILQLFYNPNGSLKSFEELVNEYYNLLVMQRDFDYDCEYNKLFIPFFTYSIKRHNLDNNKENSPLNARIQIILKLLATHEAEQLQYMINGYDYFKKLEKTHLVLLNKNFQDSQNRLIKERFGRFKRYASYIKDSKEVELITKPIAPHLEDIESIEKPKSL